jgi:peptidoglycan/LPS O-acetylase OafA/YrhL
VQLLDRGKADVLKSAPPEAAPSSSVEDAGLRARLTGIDGLRAIAALWVVLFHVHLVSKATFSVPVLDAFWDSGWAGVSLFLVLSGFCLYLPFAGGRQQRFQVRSFLLRRAKRVMPAYYTSLAFVVPLYIAFAVPLGGSRHLSLADTAWHALTHATMTHIFFTSTFYSLNGVYWSLALEWQFYLTLPLLLIGILRFGFAKTAAFAIGVNIVYWTALHLAVWRGLVPNDPLLLGTVLSNQFFGRWAEFALGMIAAELYVSGRLGWARPLRFVAPLLLPAILVASYMPMTNVLTGVAFFLLVCLVLASSNWVSRLFSWKPLVALGLMSYSLYLVHHPILKVLTYVVRTRLHAAPNEVFVLLVLFGFPIVLAAAWVLFMTAERPTLSARQSLRSLPGYSILVPSFLVTAWRRFFPVRLASTTAVGD